jgi:PIN domain nuclease of toxin-antitoxin system
MKYLLDTCTVIWFMSYPEKLPPQIDKIISTEKKNIYVSAITAVEIAIKLSNGKLDISVDTVGFLEYIRKAKFNIIDFKAPYAEILEKLPFIHKEPFDRMIIATAKYENMTILTADTKIHQYDVKTLWQ